jgi:hypothetical protein
MSDNGRRDVPLSMELARELWTRQGRPGELILTNARSERIDSTWARKNVLKPAAKAAGVPWAGFHTFRHTCVDPVRQRQEPQAGADMARALRPAFTLRTYVHLIDDGLGDADFLDAAAWARGGATGGATRATRNEADAAPARAGKRLDRAIAANAGKAEQTHDGTHNR